MMGMDQNISDCFTNRNDIDNQSYFKIMGNSNKKNDGGEDVDEVLFEDKDVKITKGFVYIKWYFFPTAGTKKIPISTIKQVEKKDLGWAKGRLWGMDATRWGYWLAGDKSRLSRTQFIGIHVQSSVKPSFTTENNWSGLKEKVMGALQKKQTEQVKNKKWFHQKNKRQIEIIDLQQPIFFQQIQSHFTVQKIQLKRTFFCKKYFSDNQLEIMINNCLASQISSLINHEKMKNNFVQKNNSLKIRERKKSEIIQIESKNEKKRSNVLRLKSLSNNQKPAQCQFLPLNTLVPKKIIDEKMEKNRIRIEERKKSHTTFTLNDKMNLPKVEPPKETSKKHGIEEKQLCYEFQEEINDRFSQNQNIFNNKKGKRKSCLKKATKFGSQKRDQNAQNQFEKDFNEKIEIKQRRRGGKIFESQWSDQIFFKPRS